MSNSFRATTITDQELVDLMNRGTLWLEGSAVYKRHPRGRVYRLHVREYHGRPNVNIRLQKRQRTAYVSKLVWMWHHRKPVPDGYVVDHKNGDKKDNRPCNLRLHTEYESDLQGYHKQQESFSFQDRVDQGLPLYDGEGIPLYF